MIHIPEGSPFPISNLPGSVQWVAQATPLWHGVELCRNAVHGRLELRSTIVHVAYLTTLVAVGWLAARRTFARRLSA